jgi:hypothetical protein
MIRPGMHLTVSKKTVSIVNHVMNKKDLKKSYAVDYICSMYYDNMDILEDPEAFQVAREWIRKRNERLAQSLLTSDTSQ